MATLRERIERYDGQMFFDSAIISVGYAPYLRDLDVVIDRPAAKPTTAVATTPGVASRAATATGSRTAWKPASLRRAPPRVGSVRGRGKVPARLHIETSLMSPVRLDVETPVVDVSDGSKAFAVSVKLVSEAHGDQDVAVEVVEAPPGWQVTLQGLPYRLLAPGKSSSVRVRALLLGDTSRPRRSQLAPITLRATPNGDPLSAVNAEIYVQL